MRVVSTFAGCGGSSLGYKRAGCQVVAAVEWDAHAATCYRLNHPSTLVMQRDIKTVTGVEIMEATGLAVGELDILDGSPPCQGFSTSGKRVLDDPRNSLFREHLRLVDELHPRAVVIENVAGMVKGKMRGVAGEIVRELKARGYMVAAGLLDAQFFGVPQRRLRSVFIGSMVGQPTLPRATSRPIPCKVALAGVEPDEWRWPTTPGQRLVAGNMLPGDRDAAEVLQRLGRKWAWYSIKILDPDRVSWTIHKTYGGQTLWHWDRRHVSIREALVLTGFPPDYNLPGTFSERWARIGNSVAPPMTEAIARMLEALHA